MHARRYSEGLAEPLGFGANERREGAIRTYRQTAGDGRQLRLGNGLRSLVWTTARTREPSRTLHADHTTAYPSLLHLRGQHIAASRRPLRHLIQHSSNHTQCALQHGQSRSSRSPPSLTPSHSRTSHHAQTRTPSPLPAIRSTPQTSRIASQKTSRTRHVAPRVSTAWWTSHSKYRAAVPTTRVTM